MLCPAIVELPDDYHNDYQWWQEQRERDHGPPATLTQAAPQTLPGAPAPHADAGTASTWPGAASATQQGWAPSPPSRSPQDARPQGMQALPAPPTCVYGQGGTQPAPPPTRTNAEARGTDMTPSWARHPAPPGPSSAWPAAAQLQAAQQTWPPDVVPPPVPPVATQLSGVRPGPPLFPSPAWRSGR